MKTFEAIRCAAILTLAGACCAHAQPRYEFQRLEGLGDHGLSGVGAVTEDGFVLGNSSPASQGPAGPVRLRPVRWVNGHATPLPHLPTGTGLNAFASAANSSGIIAGGSSYERDMGYGLLFMHAVMWEGNRIKDLGTLPGDLDSSAYAINDAGVVVGQSSPDYFYWGNTRAFRYQAGAMAALPAYPNQYDAIAAGINNAGLIVGAAGDFWGLPPWTVPVYWDQAGVHALALPVGADGGEAHAINEQGDIVGRAGFTDPNFFEPFAGFTPVRWVGGAAQALPLLPGDNAGSANNVNESGVIVGVSGQIDPGSGFIITQRPVAWVGGSAVDLMAAANMPPEWSGFIFFVRGLNNAGQIAGTTYGEVNGEFVGYGFLLTPDQ